MRYFSSSSAMTYKHEILEESLVDLMDMSRHLVELFVEVRQLGRLCHLVLVHHERWLESLVASLTKELESVGDKSLIEIDAIVGQEVTPVTSDFCT